LHIGKRWIDSMMVDSTENEDGDMVYDTNFSYKIKERFRLSHMMDYQDNNRYYLDPSLNDDFYNLWYDTSHIVKGAEQFDSSYFRMLKNDLLLNYTNYKSPQLLSTVYAGISILNEGHYFLNHHPLTVNDTGFLNTTASTFMRLGLKNMGNKKFLYSFDYSGGFLGNRVGEHLMTTTLLRSISSKNHLYIKLEGSDYLRKPDYFVRNYSSFIRSWSKDLKDQQTRTVNLAITNLKNLNFYYGFVFEKDLVFFEDTTIGPVQSPGEKRVVQIGVNYDFQLWRFVFNNKVLNQNASAKGMTRVPEWMFSHTIYYDKAFTIKSTGGKFHIQIGIDAFYFTKFEAMTYNPITAQFFNVHGHYLGNYPYVDAFVNFKLKRARLFLMAEHLSYGWFGNNYYTLYNFPMNPRTIKFGFSWNFYN